MLLYNVIIRPIEYLTEVVYVVMASLLGNPGYAVIAVSLCISLLTLPLYVRAEHIQEKIRDGQKEMEPWIRHIRRNFRAEERQMMLFAYYKERNYSPILGLAGLAPLLLQVPFFIAAYRFLSRMEPESALSFGPIRNLMAADGLLTVGEIRLNLLPILMTLINIVSAFVYLKGTSLKDKIQPLVLALFFLILLYPSPAGLVLYWTCNNLFSLGKNIAMKTMKHPERLITVLSVSAAVFILLSLITSGKLLEAVRGREDELLLYAALFFLLLLPVIRGIFRRIGPRTGKTGQEKVHNTLGRHPVRKADNSRNTVLIAEGVIALLIGVIHPLLVIASSPLEFLEADRGLVSPLHYVFFSFCVATGICFFWGNLYYRIMDEKGKKLYACVLCILAVVFAVNSFAFGWKGFTLSSMLIYDLPPHYEEKKIWYLNLFLILAVSLAVALMYRYLYGFLRSALAVLLLALTFFSGYHLVKIVDVVGADQRNWETEPAGQIISFSRTGKNVIVIMLDRAIGSYVPYIFDEKPELLAAFDGFTYYPNTVSAGDGTIYGAPSLYGGYEYTPEAMNDRPEERLGAKHGEALRVMPAIFEEAGYRVYAADLPYVGSALPEGASHAELFADLPGVRYCEFREGLPPFYDTRQFVELRERGFFFYGLMKCAPAVYQDEVYDSGHYLSASRMRARGGPGFLDSYNVLWNLPLLTGAEDDTAGSFFVMCNDTTHEPAILSLPDYEVFGEMNNASYDILADHTVNGRVLHFDPENVDFNVGHYHSFMAAFMMLGEWFDDLREWGVYDNTRIILVSDHGWDLGQFDDMILEDGFDTEKLNALLMVKDFGSSGFTVSDSFMTPADVPALATAGGVVPAPVVNPFTGAPIDMSGKENGLNVISSHSRGFGDRYVFDEEGDRWYHVENDIFEKENWSAIGRP